MLSEDKIKLMTGIAMFEKKEGRNIFHINRYFKGDYISSHMLRSFFSFTVSCILAMVVWALYSIEGLLNTTDTSHLMELGRKTAFFYLIGLMIYLVITYWVYAKRYEYANRGVKFYTAKLKRLKKRYEFQGKTKELKEGGRHDGSTRI